MEAFLNAEDSSAWSLGLRGARVDPTAGSCRRRLRPHRPPAESLHKRPRGEEARLGFCSVFDRCCQGLGLGRCRPGVGPVFAGFWAGLGPVLGPLWPSFGPVLAWTSRAQKLDGAPMFNPAD